MIDCTELAPDYVNDLYRWAKENEVPLSMTFELTPFCNFSCVMCYIRLTPEQARQQGQLLRADQWLELARQAKEMGTLYLTLTGGEPLTHPEFWQIYSQLNQMGFLITVLSNGSVIDESVIDKFRQYGMPYFMKLTLYGASDETYLRTCGCADGYRRVTKAVDLLQEAGIPLTMTATIVRENACDLQKIYQFARSRGIPMQHTVSVVRSSRGAVNQAEASRFDFDEFTEEMTHDMLERSKFPPLDSPFAWCANLGRSLWITWNGRLQLCSFLSTPSVPWTGRLSQNWPLLLRNLRALKSPEKCSHCEWSSFCQRCPGILCAESGHPEQTAQSMCQLAQRMTVLYQQCSDKEDSYEKSIYRTGK